eukprot:509751_1
MGNKFRKQKDNDYKIKWSCSHCTFENTKQSQLCEICGNINKHLLSKNNKTTNELNLSYYTTTSMSYSDIKILHQIFENILNDPDNEKYHRLKIDILSTTFKNNIQCLDILSKAGFYESNNGTFFIFDKTKLQQLKSVKGTLNRDYPLCPEPPNNKLFFTDELGTFNKFQKEKQQLLSMGFDSLSSHLALIETNGNLENAIEYMFKDHTTETNVTTNNNDSNENCNYCKVDSCSSVNRLVTAIAHYNDNIDNDNDVDIEEILNCYLHLLSQHNDDEQYEQIYHRIIKLIGAPCVIQKCKMFSRNHRDRNGEQNRYYQLMKQLYKSDDHRDIVHQQIMDKIHCYCLHSYDRGYKISSSDKMTIKNTKPNIQNDFIGTNRELFVTNTIISTKHEKFTENRINKFITSNVERKIEEQKHDTINEKSNEMYGFGILF